MVEFKGPAQHRFVKGKEYARVETRITWWESDAEIEIGFLLRHLGKDQWTLCDVYVEGVSKARVYRKELRKIYTKRGFRGVERALKQNITKYGISPVSKVFLKKIKKPLTNPRKLL